MRRTIQYFSVAFKAALLAWLASAVQMPAQSPPYPYVPLFQYDFFCETNMEFDSGGSFSVNGPVFSNGGIWSGAPDITFSSTVEAVGTINTSAADPYSTEITTGPPVSIFTLPIQPVSSVIPASLGLSGLSFTNAEAMINLPPANARAPQTIAYTGTNQVYLFNAASLIISNNYYGSNTVAPWSNNFTVYLQDSTLEPYYVSSNGVPMNWIQLTNDVFIISNSYLGQTFFYETSNVPGFRFTNDVSSLRFTNSAEPHIGTNQVWYAGFSFLTNMTFYDYRETTTVEAVQIDVGKLGSWIAASYKNGGSNWNHELCEDTGHGINSVFVYNAVPFLGQQQLPAVRLVNGQQLPISTNFNVEIGGVNFPQLVSSGLSVITPQPLYVLGNYNVQIAGGFPVLYSHNTASTYPAALMADAITILSTSWKDAYTAATPLDSRTGTTTTINAACMSGIVPSNGTRYSGGIENVLRLQESWEGVLFYNGSIAAMFPSIYATNSWQANGLYYEAPTRNWSFDTNFNLPQDLPPLTPFVINSNAFPTIVAQPVNEILLAGQSTNFSVTASGFPNVGYQWSFDGTNLSGATNNLLELTNVQPANTGDYSVEVTNNLGLVITSNALLSVYTSPVPILGALSFSSANGASFTVTGVPGFNYTVQVSTNLVDWLPVITNNSPFDFNDTNLDFPQRFYRSIYIP